MSDSFKEPIIYQNFKGVNNRERSYRLQNAKDGINLKDGVNVDIDRAGAIESREGTEMIWSHGTSNLYTNGRDVIGVVANNLSIIYPDSGWLHTTILANVGSDPWTYVTVGSKIYASNNLEIGYIENGTWNEFTAPTQTYKRLFPPCKHLEFYNGRIYGAVDNLVIFSDPMWFEVIDERNDRSFMQFESEVTMIEECGDGIWVGTKDSLYFIKGASPQEFTLSKITDYGVIADTGRSLSYTYVNGELWPNVIWVTTTKGICALGDGGKFANNMENTYSMPVISRGTAYIRRGRINQYVSIVK